jgi:glycine/D-amino acid oxidase-like deaminating enzyme
MNTSSPDILILGAGVLGSSTAWHLARMGEQNITVVDLDLAGTYSSSELNAGGARATWWHRINAELAWLSIQFYKSIAKEIQFFQKGYLFLHNQTRWKIAQEKKGMYESLNIPIEYLKPSDIPSFIPEFKNLKGIAGGTFSPQDGLLDPHLLRDYYRNQAKGLGVQFLDHTYVTRMQKNSNGIQSVHALHSKENLGEEKLEKILTTHQVDAKESWEEITFHPKIVINCTGAWLKITSKYYDQPQPIQPIRRQISLFSSHEEDFSGKGMIVDSSGLYFHPEGNHTGLVLAGYSNRDEKPGYSFKYDGEPFFDRKIWLRLYRRGNREHFEAIKHVRGWAGLYAVGPDKTGVLGQVEGFHNLYELGAATGRGVMQSYALGLLLAELIWKGRFETLDGASLSPKRFETGKFITESLDI